MTGEKIRNECIREKTVDSTRIVMKSPRLRWYEHAERIRRNTAPAMARKILVHGKKIRRSKRRIKLITNDISRKKLMGANPQSRNAWKRPQKPEDLLVGTNTKSTELKRQMDDFNDSFAKLCHETNSIETRSRTTSFLNLKYFS